MNDPDFDSFVTRIHPNLVRRARSFVDDASADDIVAVTLVTLWQKSRLASWNEHAEGQRVALSHAILLGHVRNEYRARARRSALEGRLVEQDRRSVADDWSGVDLRLTLDAAVLALEAPLRRAIVLHELGFGVSDAARLTAVTAATASRRRDAAVAHVRRGFGLDRPV